MAAAVILTSKNRSRRNLLEGIAKETIQNESHLLPGQPWEADLILRVLSGGRWAAFSVESQ